MRKITHHTRTFWIFGCVGIAMLSLGSCKKFLNPSPEQGSLQSTNVFTTDGTATAAVEGIYSSMMYSGIGYNMDNGSLGVLLGLAADELDEFNPTYPDWLANQYYYTTGVPVYFMWSVDYNSIYQANSAIEGITAATTIDDSIKKQLLGECYFLRAFHYFELVNCYGGVPLALSSSYTSNQSLARSDSTAVYAQIIADLQMAKSLLTPNYPSVSEVRANFYAAQALMARVYLYHGDFALAQAQADSVLAGPYYLEPNLNNVFQNTSNEVIWELLPVAGGANNAYDFGYYTPASATSGPKYYLTPSLLNSFETGDNRSTTWVTAYSFSGTTYYYPSKYVTPPSSPATQYNVVLRLAEQFLIDAEARAQQGDLSGAAIRLNAVRSRAGLGATTATTQSALLTAIEHERQVELFTEWGHRWFDLRRTGTINATLGSLKPTWTPDASLLPIPYQEIEADPNLQQNPGYN